MAANMIDAIYTRLYSVFIGKMYSARDLGYYSRAQSTQQMPTQLLANMLNRVALPAFSRTSSDPVVLAQALAKASRLLMFVNLPLMAGMAAIARPLVLAVFGPRWLPAVPLLQVLCVVGALWPLQVLNVSALLAQGQARLVLRIEMIKKGFGVLALVLASPYGLLAIAWSQVVTACFAFLVNGYYSGRLLGFGAASQLWALARNILASLVMLAIVVSVQHSLSLPVWPKLALLVPLGVIAYLTTSIVLGVSQLREIAHQVRAGVG
jgi:teichuronic acid exporter